LSWQRGYSGQLTDNKDLRRIVLLVYEYRNSRKEIADLQHKMKHMVVKRVCDSCFEGVVIPTETGFTVCPVCDKNRFANKDREIADLRAALEAIDGEIRLASPTMSGEPNYRVTLDAAKRIKKLIKEALRGEHG